MANMASVAYAIEGPKESLEQIQSIGNGVPACLHEDVIKNHSDRIFILGQITITFIQIQKIQGVFFLTLSAAVVGYGVRVILPVVIYVHIQVCKAFCTTY